MLNFRNNKCFLASIDHYYIILTIDIISIVTIYIILTIKTIFRFNSQDSF